MDHNEKQLTFDAKGHTLNRTQCFSADDQWIVYDTRNEDSKIGSTGSIEIINVITGEIKELYKTQDQTEYGPGVGAVTFSPTENKVLFIHGIRNASKEKPYDFTRRTGVMIDIAKPYEPIFADARDINEPFTEGALRGGTHAHSWSGDGKRISFTYNDYVLEQLAKSNPGVKDLRTVGVMVPGAVTVPGDSTKENNGGSMYSVIVTSVTEQPEAGSDEINKAFDECWIGENGYLKADGTKQQYAIAFQGNVVDKAGKIKTEVFVADLPEDLKKANPGKPLEGTPSTRPNAPQGVHQRRITFTEKGVSGLRHWLGATKNGALILFLAEDKNELTQVYGVSPNGGNIKQLTFGEYAVKSGFGMHPDGKLIAYLADNSIFITDITNGKTKRITKRYTGTAQPVGAIVWSNDGKQLAYNRYVAGKSENFLQIFLLAI